MDRNTSFKEIEAYNEASVKKNEVLFVKTQLHEDTSEFEKSSVDVWITNGSDAWCNLGAVFVDVAVAKCCHLSLCKTWTQLGKLRRLPFGL